MMFESRSVGKRFGKAAARETTSSHASSIMIPNQSNKSSVITREHCNVPPEPTLLHIPNHFSFDTEAEEGPKNNNKNNQPWNF